MIRTTLGVLMALAAVAAPIPTSPEQTAKLKALVAASPKLDVTRADLPVQAPSAGWAMDMVSSAASGPDGLIYAFQRGAKADPVAVFDRSGKLVRSFGRGLYKIPHSIRVDPKGDVWTVDAASSMVYRHSPKGEKLLEIAVGGQPADHKSDFKGTTDICFAPNGHIYVSDGYGNARVLEYTREGKKVREWGRHGTGPGEMYVVHGITVDRDGTLFVADRENGRIQRFDATGKFLGMWDHLGKTFSITMAADGSLWIGSQPRTSPNGADGWLMKIDKRTGAILGYVDSPGHHSIDVTRGGDLLTGARPDHVVLFRKR